ncbi:hypothetical protein L596_021766 [Steinernema carpocapsae]|uniref:7TM GPCR serpentine receptor class x (Srx) domain-containing protein n=1 Tax=Steinernema carpocapsae TaxID=34508 RepID=A0A4U5MJR6_STECR|nr:hypothetical protein L596_021766 [Steinernema carpocapsae]
MTICQSSLDYRLERVLGVLIQSTWFLYLSLSLVLAVDRLLIFSPINQALNTYIIVFLLILSWLFFALVTVVESLPGFGLTYATFLVWQHKKGSGPLVLFEVESYVDPCTLIVILAIYLLVVGRLIMIKLSSTGYSVSLKLELRILLSAVISFIYEFFLVTLNFWNPIHFEDSKYLYICLNIMWMIDSGIFAMVTFMVNGSVRKKLREILCGKKHKVMVLYVT